MTTGTETDPTTAPAPAPGTGGQEGDGGAPSDPEGAQSFDLAYVTGLRDESARYRQRAHDAEARSQRALEALWEARRAEATAGLLADPTDLAGTVEMLDDDGLPDLERIRTAAEELATRKPHLRERRPSGTIDQGPRGSTSEVNLADRLRRLAG
jgi:hypothetical protein